MLDALAMYKFSITDLVDHWSRGTHCIFPTNSTCLVNIPRSMNKQTESIPQGWIEHLKTESVYLSLLFHKHLRQPNPSE